jgi:hypothetical protein
MAEQNKEVGGVKFQPVGSEWAEKESRDYSEFYEALEA